MDLNESRVVVVNDSVEFNDAITSKLHKWGCEVVASALTEDEANVVIDKLGELGANVVLMDCNLGGPTGIEGYGLVGRLQSEHPTIPVISISNNENMGSDMGIPNAVANSSGSQTLKNILESL